MATKIKDSATATQAALGLNNTNGVEGAATGEPKALQDRSTSEQLFPEFTTDDGGIVNRPVRPFEDKSKPLPASMTPETKAPLPQNPSPAAPTTPNYLKIDEMTGKMVKVKVDGVESDVPAEALLKSFQLEQHLNAKLEKLAQDRKALEQERANFRATPTPAPDAPKQAPNAPKGNKAPEVQELEAQIAAMQAQMVALQSTLLPQTQEAGVKRLESMVKDKLGADDFRSYFEKIRDSALEESRKPEVAADPNALRWLDSDNYYFQKYQEMKLRDLMSTSPKPTLNQPIQNGAPVLVDTHGLPVNVPVIEGSGGVPSRDGSNNDWATKAQAAFDKARNSGSMADWMVYQKIKANGPA